jgi:hypothetical protein
MTLVFNVLFFVGQIKLNPSEFIIIVGMGKNNWENQHFHTRN